MTNKWDKLNEETHQICDKLIELKNDIDYFESTNNKEEMYIISQTETYPMTKTIKETWKEEIYEIITHNETSECHSKLVALVESLISQVEALVREQTVEEILELAYDVNLDDRGASPLYAVTGEEIKDYAKTKNITL